MGFFGVWVTAECQSGPLNNCSQLGVPWWSHWGQLQSSGHLQMSKWLIRHGHGSWGTSVSYRRLGACSGPCPTWIVLHWTDWTNNWTSRSLFALTSISVVFPLFLSDLTIDVFSVTSWPAGQGQGGSSLQSPTCWFCFMIISLDSLLLISIQYFKLGEQKQSWMSDFFTGN